MQLIQRLKGTVYDTDNFMKLIEKNKCPGIKRIHRSKTVELIPYHLRDVKKGVKSVLDESLHKFDSELGGVLVGYENIKVSASGSIVRADRSSFLVEGDYYVFNPSIGTRIFATVNTCGEDVIACLAYTLFNIACPKEYKGIVVDNWPGKLPNGQLVTIKLTHIELQKAIPYLRGEIVNYLEQKSSNEKHPKKKIKRKSVEDTKSTDNKRSKREEKSSDDGEN